MRFANRKCLPHKDALRPPALLKEEREGSVTLEQNYQELAPGRGEHFPSNFTNLHTHGCSERDLWIEGSMLWSQERIKTGVRSLRFPA